jgi:hypothetical protein
MDRAIPGWVGGRVWKKESRRVVRVWAGERKLERRGGGITRKKARNLEWYIAKSI